MTYSKREAQVLGKIARLERACFFCLEQEATWSRRVTTSREMVAIHEINPVYEDHQVDLPICAGCRKGYKDRIAIAVALGLFGLAAWGVQQAFFPVEIIGALITAALGAVLIFVGIGVFAGNVYNDDLARQSWRIHLDHRRGQNLE